MSETYENRSETPKVLCGAICPHPPILVPEVGRGSEQDAAGTLEGMERLAQAVAACEPEVIICVTPHGPAFRDALHIQDIDSMDGDMGAFGVPDLQMSCPVDRELSNAIAAEIEDAGVLVVRGQHAVMDHGCFVPLYFIRKHWDAFRLVHITSSFQEPRAHMQAGAAIRSVVAKKGIRALLLASGDLSHVLRSDGPYGYHRSGPVFDREVEAILRAGRLNELADLDPVMVEEAAQCGLHPISVLAGFFGFSADEASSRAAPVEIYSHEAPFGVGYLAGYLKKPVEAGGEDG